MARTAGGRKRDTLDHFDSIGRRISRRALYGSLFPGAALAIASSWLARHRTAARPPIAQQTQAAAIVPGLAADSAAAAVTLREKIGHMVVAGFRGFEVGPERVIAQDISDRHLAGVVLFDYDVPTGSTTRNIASPAQLAALTEQLRAMAPGPLLIAVDQEGGVVARLKPAHGFPATFSAAELGAQDDPEATYAAAAAIAQTLAAAGINLNFAPVVDLDVNPDNPVIGALDRSFSADPDVVARNAAAFIRALHDNGVLCALKHFPGHGSSTADSHLGFVDVTGTWTEQELEPYSALIAEGLVDCVMTAHVFNATIDADYPATLSYNTITGILRNDLGYDGVVISDDMQMAAITSQFGFEVAVEEAIEAGVDILLSGNNLVYDETTPARVIDLVESLVAGGVISEARIEQSYQRIAALKARL